MSETSNSTNASRRVMPPPLYWAQKLDLLTSERRLPSEINEELSKQYEGHRKLTASLSTPASSNVCRPEVPHCSSINFLEENRTKLKRLSSVRNALSYGKSVMSNNSEKFSNKAAKFFGVSSQKIASDSLAPIVDPELKWKRRRLRYIHRRYSRFGGYKEDEAQKELGNEGPNGIINVEVELATTPTAIITGPMESAPEGIKNGLTSVNRSISVDSNGKEKLLRRDSVAKVAWNSLSYFLQRGSTRNALSRQTSKSIVEEERLSSMSFTPLVVQPFKGNINTHMVDGAPMIDVSKNTPDSVHLDTATCEPATFSLSSPASKNTDEASIATESDVERGYDNDRSGSLLQAFSEKIEPTLLDDKNEETSSTQQSYHTAVETGEITSRHFRFPTVDRPVVDGYSDDERDAFFGFDSVSVSSCDEHESISGLVGEEASEYVSASLENKTRYATDEVESTVTYLNRVVQRPTSLDLPVASTSYRRVRTGIRLFSDEEVTAPLFKGDVTSQAFMEMKADAAPQLFPEIKESQPNMREMGDYESYAEEPTPFSGRMQKIKEIFRTRASRPPKSRFHGVGFGLWRKCFQRGLHRVDYETAAKIENFEDHRPFFTYYVTSVQILVCIATLLFYGFEPIGFDRQERTASVLHTSVVLRQVSIYELENMWIGPKFSDLVRLGAKYSPCMRRDPQIYQQIEKERQLESETGCCIYNDGVGCFQASKNECPTLIAVLLKWTKANIGPHGQTSGAVCGQDPNYCQEPLSTPPFVWSENISQWPICIRPSLNIPEDQKHLHCDITGRPCCILLHGQCRITTREYCDFVHGIYHPNATLCSQVSCISEVCGMLPFLHKDQPDQFYRLFLSLFLHAGILHCTLTVLIHWYYMRDLEKLIGCGRLALLYMGSGIGGNLASAVLMPYKPEVGPSGSLFGVFSAMYADVVYNWHLIAKPWSALKDLTMFTVIIFAAGVLPWIDNWAHIFGFIFGLLISLGTFPYFNFFGYSRQKRVFTVIGCWVSIVLLYVLFFLKFYKWPVVSWKWTEYINCIPFTDHMCDNQGLELKTWLNI